MNISDLQLKKIAAAGGIKEVDNLIARKKDNTFELGVEKENGDWETVFTLKFIVGACSDSVEFAAKPDNFDHDAARSKMENLGLIEKL